MTDSEVYTDAAGRAAWEREQAAKRASRAAEHRVQDAKEELTRLRLRRRVIAMLARHPEGMPRGDVRRFLAARDRHLFSAILANLALEGRVTVAPGVKGYREVVFVHLVSDDLASEPKVRVYVRKDPATVARQARARVAAPSRADVRKVRHIIATYLAGHPFGATAVNVREGVRGQLGSLEGLYETALSGMLDEGSAYAFEFEGIPCLSFTRPATST